LRLVDELGTEPGPGLQEVHRAVLLGDLAEPLLQADTVTALVPHVFGLAWV